MKEKNTQNTIRLALSPYAITFRVNVGLFYTFDGRQVSTGVPAGFSDLFGFRKKDGRAFFIEVKGKGGKPSKKQLDFIKAVKKQGALAGVAWSVEDAFKILEVDIDEF